MTFLFDFDSCKKIIIYFLKKYPIIVDFISGYHLQSEDIRASLGDDEIYNKFIKCDVKDGKILLIDFLFEISRLIDVGASFFSRLLESESIVDLVRLETTGKLFQHLFKLNNQQILIVLNTRDDWTDEDCIFKIQFFVKITEILFEHRSKFNKDNLIISINVMTLALEKIPHSISPILFASNFFPLFSRFFESYSENLGRSYYSKYYFNKHFISMIKIIQNGEGKKNYIKSYCPDNIISEEIQNLAEAEINSSSIHISAKGKTII